MKIAVAHAGWMPDRTRTLTRLLNTLRVGHHDADIKIFTSKRREHASIWATRIWEWVAEQNEHVAVLNDDVFVIADFSETCDAIVKAVPDEIISLHTQAPGVVQVALDGWHWARCYWLTGPGYILSPQDAEGILAYAAELPWEFRSRVNEDNVAIHYAYDRQRPIYQTIPACVHHDTTTASSLGYDNHLFRVPSVPWTECLAEKFTDPGYWRLTDEPPFVENPWMPPARLHYVRRILRAKRPLCVLCMDREGQVGRMTAGGPAICTHCTNHCHSIVNNQK